jgi:aminoglycoside 3-N-acetyltransferase
MSTEAEIIAWSPRPSTASTLSAGIRGLGLTDGDVVIVHSSLSKLGWIAGGAQALLEALRAVVGAAGTIVMPTHSGQLSDPAGWSNPPVPTEWVRTTRTTPPSTSPKNAPHGQARATHLKALRCSSAESDSG